jgi:hypothetical protein
LALLAQLACKAGTLRCGSDAACQPLAGDASAAADLDFAGEMSAQRDGVAVDLKSSDRDGVALGPDGQLPPSDVGPSDQTNPVSWKYPLRANITATVFWVGEEASSANGFIANDDSAWDSLWKEHYGGIDDPQQRNGYNPQGFVPKENPFYIALPYNDFKGSKRKSDFQSVVPWAAGQTYAGKESALKNRWVQVSAKGKTCYGQWEDVGPYHEDDQGYVFGTDPPKNSTAPKAGIDLSPALRDCLGVGQTSTVSWRFVDDDELPTGPWSTIVTTSDCTW